jgi:hypothetical protein
MRSWLEKSAEVKGEEDEKGVPNFFGDCIVGQLDFNCELYYL